MKKINGYVLPLTLAASSLLLTACVGNPTWQSDYDKISKPLHKEYREKAKHLTSDPSNYRFHFRLIFERVANQKFALHARYPNGIAELTDEAKQQIRTQLKPLLKDDLQEINIQVIGHSDNVALSPSLLSRFADNTALSTERARQVALFIRQELKLSEQAVTYTGVGASQAIAANDSKAGRAENRRVEISSGYEKASIQVVENSEQEMQLQNIPTNYIPWWRPLVVDQMNPKSQRLNQSLEQLMIRALKHSTQIKVFSDLPLIRETVIDEAIGQLDTHVFVQGKYDQIDKPTGTTLETGGPDRFQEHNFILEAGLRKELRSGGEIELSQQMGYKDNNSRFFNPHDQGTTRLTLTLRQSLLNGMGYEYNTSQIEIAKIDHTISIGEFTRQASAHLLEIERAYWALYLERSNLLQKKKLFTEAEKVVAELKARRSVDTLDSQLKQASAVLSQRYADSIRSEQAVRNAEGKLVSLINDPELLAHEKFELVTTDAPQVRQAQRDVKHAAEIALQRRPEISQAFKQLKAGVIRAQMTKHELMPVLDLMVEGSLYGLRGNYDVGDAYGDQFTEGEPSWSVGLIFDMPLSNRIAKARHLRRRIEIRQLTQQLRTTIETILLEVQVAVRELDTSYREMLSQYQAMLATKASLDTLTERRSINLVQDNQGLYLQRLLQSQEDLAASEQGFLESYVSYNIAHSNFDRATGLFLESRELEPKKSEDEDTNLPVMRLEHIEKK
jgi:outer membrane protein OmpA-like peptidoglycan-associated protein